jgi:hypothetical protein
MAPTPTPIPTIEEISEWATSENCCAYGEQWWQRAVAILLGGIYTNGGGGGGGGGQEAAVAEGELSYASVIASYSTLITNTAEGRILTVTNLLNVAVQISFNATVAAVTVPANGTAALDLGSNDRWVSTNISVKALGTPSSGTVYASLIG